MNRIIVLPLTMALLSACDSSGVQAQKDKATIAALRSQLAAYESEKKKLLEDRAATSAPKPEMAAKTSKSAQSSEDVAVDTDLTETIAVRDMCWQDYCPCDGEGNPDMDRMLCRNLRGGIEVTPDMMASGAGMKDAHLAMSRWQAENPGY